MEKRIRNAKDAEEHLERRSARMREGQWIIWDGEGWHFADTSDSCDLNKANLQFIRKSLQEYKKHKNDPYAYDQREIDAIRKLESNAEEYIEFLLNVVDRAAQ